ncbi:hypothetical protein ig2599ANME_0272 [groundwater metagenome]
MQGLNLHNATETYGTIYRGLYYHSNTIVLLTRRIILMPV